MVRTKRPKSTHGSTPSELVIGTFFLLCDDADVL
jgi:hypothetical protein